MIVTAKFKKPSKELLTAANASRRFRRHGVETPEAVGFLVVEDQRSRIRSESNLPVLVEVFPRALSAAELPIVVDAAAGVDGHLFPPKEHTEIAVSVCVVGQPISLVLFTRESIQRWSCPSLPEKACHLFALMEVLLLEFRPSI